MWLYLCCYIFCSVLISGEVITLINENKITCVLTEGSVNSTLDVNPEGGLNNVRRRVQEITNWKKSDWILKNSTHFNFGPVLDQRWTDFTGIGNEDTDLSDRETFSVCTRNEWNITVAASGDRKNVTIPRHDITWSLNIQFVFFKIDLLALQKSSCSWRHYTPRKTGYGVILTSVRNEIINTSLKFDALWINFPNDKNYKLHRYEFLFANTSSTEVSYIVVNFTQCVTFYVSVDTGCYLNISLSSERSSKSIRVDGFNEQNTFRKWKKYEMRNEIGVSGIVSFFRGRNDSSTIGFWAIDDIHSCDSEIGPSYLNCEKHRICSSGGRCHCAWGYEGTNCTEVCEKGSWGIDCKEKCNINCQKCDRMSGCTQCKKKYFGANCTFELPVVRKPPSLESVGEDFVKISINFEYGVNEATPEAYVLQFKYLNKKNFHNVMAVKDYPGSTKNVSLRLKISREHSYVIRIILISYSLSFQDSTVPRSRTIRRGRLGAANLARPAWREIFWRKANLAQGHFGASHLGAGHLGADELTPRKII
ncbi:uncharacterized protein LOC135134247 [Zophobas morio]|uniref:uncharacterized protein LOC135134247 n=1 Tax=Zophobas morio TaxID=2755281 RepID=UPI003083AD39